LLKNKLCAVIGKVSMDMIAIDISRINQVAIGDEVILMGNDKTTAEELATRYKGSSYELLCQIGRRARRYYFENNKLINSSPLLRREFYSRDYSQNKLSSIIESAIEQRLQSKEIAAMVQENLLMQLFSDKDNDVHYRKNFIHSITFQDSSEQPDFYKVITNLTYFKVLKRDSFIVACANNADKLEKYFRQSEVEYRWLLDNKFPLNKNFFSVTSIMVNKLVLKHESYINNECMEIKCSHPFLKQFVGKEVKFSISTETFYPKSSHQLSIFITEITQGVNIKFKHNFKNVEIIPIFAGKNKFPAIIVEKDIITLRSKRNDWIFPNSGVVFVY
jgi:alanine racemase